MQIACRRPKWQRRVFCKAQIVKEIRASDDAEKYFDPLHKVIALRLVSPVMDDLICLCLVSD